MELQSVCQHTQGVHHSACGYFRGQFFQLDIKSTEPFGIVRNVFIRPDCVHVMLVKCLLTNIN